MTPSTSPPALKQEVYQLGKTGPKSANGCAEPHHTVQGQALRLHLKGADVMRTKRRPRAWLTRATRRTFKHLREEVQAVEITSRFTSTSTIPPQANNNRLKCRP